MGASGRLSVSLLVCGALLAGCGKSGVFPTTTIPSTPTAEDFPDSGAVILEDVATLTLSTDHEQSLPGQPVGAVLDHRRRIKILSKAGLDAALVTLPVDGFSTVRNLQARSISPGGTEAWLSNSKVVRQPRVQPDVRELSNLAFRIPGAKVGGVIEYRYHRAYVDADFVPPWVFADALAVLRSEFAVVLESNVTVDFREGDGPRISEASPIRSRLQDGRERLVFVRQNLRPYFREERAGHLSRVAPWIAMTVTSAREGNKTRRLETWPHVGERLLGLLGRSRPAKVSGSTSARYRLIRDKLQTVELGGLGVLLPRPAPQYLRGAPASSRDATGILFHAMKKAGLDAFPVAVAGIEAPPLDKGFPALYPFTRMMVGITVPPEGLQENCSPEQKRHAPHCRPIPDDFVFLDAACRDCRFGEVPWQSQGNQAMVVTATGTRFVDIPLARPEENSLDLTYDLALDTKGHVRGRLRGKAFGAWARSIRDALTRTRDYGGALNGLLFSEGGATRLKRSNVRQLRNVDRPVLLEANYAGDVHKFGYEKYRLQPAGLVGETLPGDWRMTRRLDALVMGPRREERLARLDLPVGYQVEDIPPVSVETPFASYQAEFQRKDRKLLYERRFELKTNVITVAQWPAFRAFIDQIRQIEAAGVRVWVSDQSLHGSGQ